MCLTSNTGQTFMFISKSKHNQSTGMIPEKKNDDVTKPSAPSKTGRPSPHTDMCAVQDSAGLPPASTVSPNHVHIVTQCHNASRGGGGTWPRRAGGYNISKFTGSSSGTYRCRQDKARSELSRYFFEILKRSPYILYTRLFPPGRAHAGVPSVVIFLI